LRKWDKTIPQTKSFPGLSVKAFRGHRYDRTEFADLSGFLAAQRSRTLVNFIEFGGTVVDVLGAE